MLLAYRTNTPQKDLVMKKDWIRALFITLCCIALHIPQTQAQEAMPVDSNTAAQHHYTLDSNAFASLITCGPGNEFYTSFGHTALRICDTSRGIDYAYNYGMFSFDEPNFYLNFVKGHLRYFLGKGSFEGFMMEYAMEGRWVQEQKLNLSFLEVNKLYQMLEVNHEPEHMYYMYDYFTDNCATRVRDMIDSIAAQRDSSKASPMTHRTDTCSFRSAMYEYTHPNLQWWQLGIDILLGARTDRYVTQWQTMFAPNTLMAVADSGMLGVSCEPARQLLREDREPLHKSFSPALLFWLVGALILAIDFFSIISKKKAYDKGSGYKRTFRLRWMDGAIFCIAGLLGLLLTFMWFGTDHYWTKANWNILWANPLFLVLLCRLNKNNVVIAVILLLCLLAAIALGCTGVLPQHYNSAVLPICLILFVRTLYRLEKK